MTSRRIVVLSSAFALLSVAQTPDSSPLQKLLAMQRAWGIKTNSAGVTLTLKEGSRVTSDGHTVVRYRMIAVGLPTDKIYSVLLWPLDGQPRTVMNGVTIDVAGTAVCAGKPGTCEGSKPDDPIDLAMSAGLGEPKRVGLLATDKSVQAFASVVPFPNRATDSGCTLEATIVTPGAEAMMLLTSS